MDQSATSDEVQIHDLLTPLPFPNNFADAIYCSHFLEHLDEQSGINFLSECFRCLKNQGILRIVVPDFERLARDYLEILDQMKTGKNSETELQWMHLEIFDQFSRSRPEGEMGPFLSKLRNSENSFIRKRVGLAINNFKSSEKMLNKSEVKRNSIGFLRTLRKFIFDSSYRTHFLMKYFFRRHYNEFLIHPSESFIKEIFWMFVPSLSYKQLKESAFRSSGEVHLQSFDYFKLKKLMIKVGFSKVTQKDAKESAIANWTFYELDTTYDGLQRKADSLYVEARKAVEN